MTKEFTIYTKKLAYQLRQCGFRIIRTGINENHPQFDVYIFADTPQFRTALTQLSHK